jgi:hypothetical protein
MNAQGSAGRAAGIVGALAALLLAHDAAADDTMIVYGKRMQKPEAARIARPAMDSAGILVALREDLTASVREDVRISLRDGFEALCAEITRDRGEAIEVKVASLGTRAGV